MAIMNEGQEIQMSSGGFKKKLNDDALDMILDHMQSTQYSYPQKSTIRELFSNAYDSVNEKLTAFAIMKGDPVEKYYVQKEGQLLTNSGYDPGYYDAQWLGTGGDYDTVIITYEEGGAIGKDKIIIEDHGVGLGSYRLAGYFQLGWSSKRLQKGMLGKWGFGAKSAYSTGIDSYLMVSRYNGWEYRFNIYLRNVQGVIPKFNTSTGAINDSIVIDGEVIYRIPTTEKNGVRIEIDVKKHHKQTYIDAVKSQLLYFPNIEFRLRPYGQSYNVVPVKASIIYEDDTMVLSDNNQYSKPHILISKINYGVIDFNELELEDMTGNIGIKIPAENISVSKSRESVIWDDLTKETIRTSFEAVHNRASEIVSKELRQTDMLAWLKACINVTSFIRDANSVIGRLSKIIDMKRVAPAFSPYPAITLGTILDTLLGVKYVNYDMVVENSKKYKRLVRMPSYLDKILERPLVIRKENQSTRKTKYLLDKVYPGTGYMEIRVNPKGWTDLNQEQKSLILDRLGIEKDGTKTTWTPKGSKVTKTYDFSSEQNIAALQEYNEQVYEHLFKSASDHWKLYESIEVPEDYVASELEADEVEEVKNVEEKVEAQAALESAKERRKKEGKTVLFTFRSLDSQLLDPNRNVYALDAAGNNVIDPASGNFMMQRACEAPGYTPPRALELHKLEPKFSDIDLWKAEEIFVGNKEHESMMHMAAMITRVSDGKITNLEVPRPNDLFPHMYVSGSRNVYVTKPTRDSTPNPDYKPHELLGLNPDDIVWPQGEQIKLASWFYQNDKVKFLQVAKENMKYYRDFTHIKRFYRDIKGKTLTMSNALIRWNTARVMHKQFGKLKFLEGFSNFDVQTHDKYVRLKKYMEYNYREMEAHQDRFYGNSSEDFKNLTGYLDKVFEFQEFVRKNPDDAEAIAELARRWFNPAPDVEIANALAVDTVFYDTFIELLDYAEPIHVMFNQLQALTYKPSKDGSIPTLTPELESEIRFFCEAKSVKLYDQTMQNTNLVHADSATTDEAEVMGQDELVHAGDDTEEADS